MLFNGSSIRSSRASLASILGLLSFAGLLACDGSDDGASCTATAPLACAEPAPHYAEVKAVFDRRCATAACHSGEDQGEWPLTSYEDVESWKGAIRAEVLRCAMPPPDSGVTISADERQTILNWVQCGALE